MGCVDAQNGLGGVIVGLGGKDGRSGVNVWGFQKVRAQCDKVARRSSNLRSLHLADTRSRDIRSKYCSV